jgi:hypothetical protein
MIVALNMFYKMRYKIQIYNMKSTLVLVFLLVVIGVIGQTISFPINSSWDKELLDIKLHNVRISADNMTAAWQEMGAKYLLRANFYMGDKWATNTASFYFRKNDTTEGELLQAFLVAYPAYTYTQDEETSVTWIYPKSIHYNEILHQMVKIDHPVCGASMYTDVLNSLCRVLSTNICIYGVGGLSYGSPMSNTYDYGVNLQPGNYTVKQILNYCCIFNLTKSFAVFPDPDGRLIIEPVNLYYGNPLASREAAVKFWWGELGKPTNDIPSISEVIASMGDKSARRRWAARNYWEAAFAKYPLGIMFSKSKNPEYTVWTALGVGTVLFRGERGGQFISHLGSQFATILANVQDPALALVLSLELAREKQDPSYLDDIINKHKYSEAEINSIKPDIYRLAHESKLALKKLKSMKVDASGFSTEALRELEDTNIFTLMSPWKN